MSSKDLIIKEISNSPLVKKEYKVMLNNIHNTLPAIKQSSSNFYKSHSQFMGVTLDVTAITPIRSIKHTLAEIDKTKSALQEAQINMQKKAVKLKKKQRKLEKCKDDLDREMLEIEILELQTHSANAQNSVQGAIRKMNFFVNQYESLLSHLGIDEVTEEMYEQEENRYHIMTAMKQALNAARSRGGQIDEGNLSAVKVEKGDRPPALGVVGDKTVVDYLVRSPRCAELLEVLKGRPGCVAECLKAFERALFVKDACWKEKGREEGGVLRLQRALSWNLVCNEPSLLAPLESFVTPKPKTKNKRALAAAGACLHFLSRVATMGGAIAREIFAASVY